jgi:hypothetical protein
MSLEAETEEKTELMNKLTIMIDENEKLLIVNEKYLNES